MTEYSRARDRFMQVFEISEELSTPRLPVEALWGLVRVNGYQGSLDEACRLADQGILIADQVGDEWIASLLRLAMGASLVLAGKVSESGEWLDQALRGFQECSDPFGMSATRLWQCLGWFQRGEYHRLSQTLVDLLLTCQQNHYDYLFTRVTLLGPPDNRLIVPMLVWARENSMISRSYIDQLLGSMELSDIRFHPGYQLRVKTLGDFQVWRGSEIIAHTEWRRKKTRQLFQLLLTFRKAPLDREQICEYLWPGTEPEAASRNFKVTLNALYGVLEPDRRAGQESAYVLRESTVYGLRPEADILIDVDTFTKLIEDAGRLLETDAGQALSMYQEALDIYTGEYLPETRYAEWSAIDREHLTVLYLKAADRYCEVSLEKRGYRRVIEVCQQILAQDSCWERAYRHMMAAFDGLGDHGQVARTYKRCVDMLYSELNVPPSTETETLYKKLIRSD